MTTEDPHGTLEGLLIKACTVHPGHSCALDCPHRERVDLSQLASFDHRPKEDQAE